MSQHFAVALMLRLGLGLMLAMLSLGGRTAYAQAAPVQYLPMVGLFGSGDNPPDGSSSRYNFPSGWFLGAERNSTGLTASGLGPNAAFGPLYREGLQFGYNFNDSGAPVTLYAGFGNLKFNNAAGSLFAPSQSAAGFSANAGVEFKPTSNLSLSLGVGFTQMSGQRPNTDTSAPIMSPENPYSLLGIRRQ